jgi:hypothetical protein
MLSGAEVINLSFDNSIKVHCNTEHLCLEFPTIAKPFYRRLHYKNRHQRTKKVIIDSQIS